MVVDGVGWAWCLVSAPFFVNFVDMSDSSLPFDQSWEALTEFCALDLKAFECLGGPCALLWPCLSSCIFNAQAL